LTQEPRPPEQGPPPRGAVPPASERAAPASPGGGQVAQGSAGPRGSVVAICVVVCGVLCLWNSWKRDFWGGDEPRIAQVASHMERSGSWLVPVICGSERLDSPPLSYWLPAASHRLTGGDPRLAYRLPFLLAGMLGLWLTYLAGKRFFDGRIGFLAFAIQASTCFFYRQASWLDDDLLFAVFVQLTLTAFALRTRKGAGPAWAIAGWGGLAGCALTKSLPLACVLVFVPFLLFLFLEAGTAAVVHGLRRLRSWPGIALFLAVAGPWYVAVCLRDPTAFFEMHFVEQHFLRAIDAPYDAQPPYYYFLTVALGFLPWTLFLPLGLMHGKDRIHRNGERLTFFWALFMLVALSLVSSKKPGYMLVIWPPLSLLVSAAFFERREWFSLWEGFLRVGLFRAVPVLMKALAVMIFIVVGSAQLTGRLEEIVPRLREALSDKSALVPLTLLGALAGALIFAMSSRVDRLVREKAIPSAAFELACSVLFLYFAVSFLSPLLDSVLSSRPCFESFDAKIPAGSPVAVYGRKLPEIYYYLEKGDRRLLYLKDPDPKVPKDPEYAKMQEFLNRPEEVFLVTSKAKLEILKRQFYSLGPFLNVKEIRAAGTGEEYVLVSNK